MGEWIKRRGPTDRWHLTDAQPDGSVAIACGTALTAVSEAVSWTDPDSHPLDGERCPSCQGVFTGAVGPALPRQAAAS